MKKHITINTDTLQKIKSYFQEFDKFDDCDIYDDDYQAVEVEDAEFLQDDYYIVVTGNVTALLEEGCPSYDRDVPDDPAYFYNGGFEITSVDAYDNDGEYIDIDNIDDVLDLNEFIVIK